MELAKITSKGQITIPKDIREKMNLKTGDKILFFEENDKFFMQNSNTIALSGLRPWCVFVYATLLFLSIIHI